jgi:Mlc titration factor MtfA (ptsG expression regulator)
VLLLSFLVAIAVGVAVWFVAGEAWWRRRRRSALARRPFPAHWEDWLRARTSIYARVPVELRGRLHDLIRIFVGEKDFVGCNGLTVTEEMRVVVAAYACLLVVNRPDVPRSHFYDDLFSILVYPTPFIVPHTHRDGHGVVTEGQRVLSGQAWDSRRIIVSWQDIEDGLATGHNVVLHEFAHYLDMEDETMDGAPGLGSARAYRDWSKVFWEEYDRLRVELGAGQPTFLDPYAATAPAEFFAVVTEAFFEKPREFEQQHAGLYEQLRRYYRVDPARWEHMPG